MSEVIYTSRFPEIIAMLPQMLDAAVATGAELIKQSAQERVPVRTGELRDAIHVERKGHSEYEVLGGDGDAFYGHMVEFGTSQAPAQPFLVPAKEAEEERVIALVDVELHKL